MSTQPLDTIIRSLTELGALDIVFRMTENGVTASAYYQQSNTSQARVAASAPTATEAVSMLASKLVARRAAPYAEVR